MDSYLTHMTFGEGGFQNIRCPYCLEGNLKLESLRYAETAESLDFKRYSKNGKTDMEYFRCVGILKCDVNFCDEVVTVVGEGNTDPLFPDGPIHERPKAFWPVYFFPTILLFPINEFCPPRVRKEILKAFSHYYSDFAACANKI